MPLPLVPSGRPPNGLNAARDRGLGASGDRSLHLRFKRPYPLERAVTGQRALFAVKKNKNKVSKKGRKDILKFDTIYFSGVAVLN
jgi:hypothetical protein